MNRTTGYRPYPAQVTTETRMPIFTKTTKTDNSLDVLYIQAMDTEHKDWRTRTRETLDKSSKEEGINSGEIAVKDLEGDDEKAKMRSLASLLDELRYQGKLNDSTQVILSFKPGENPKTLDISHKKFSGSWDAEEVLKAVTGKSNSADEKASNTFNGTIHLFGFEPQEFESEDSKKNKLQKYGNILVHTSGKLNWDYHHAHMIKQIVSSAKSVEGGDPEQRTKSMRDMIQPFAGYPIIRVGAERITIKYATFRNKSNIKIYENRIRNHKAPFDMLIHSLERDSFETFKKRMDSGLKYKYSSDLGKNKDFDKARNSRLLTALVLTSKDQKEKLAYLKSEGVIIDRMQFSKTGSLREAIDKRYSKMDIDLFALLCEKSSDTNIRPINKENILPFLKQRIIADRKMSGSLDKSLEFIGKNLEKLSGENTRDLIAYVLENSKNSDEIISILDKLLKKGLSIKKLSDTNQADLIDIVSRSVIHHDVSVLDFFHQKFFDPSNYLKGEVLISYRLFSKVGHMRSSVEIQLTQKIKDNESNFIEGLIEKIRYEMVKGQTLNNSPLQFLLQCGLSPNWKSDDETSLLGCFTQDGETNVDFIIHILKNGADKNVFLQGKKYPLLTAIAANPVIDDKKSKSIIEALIDAQLVDVRDVFEGEFPALAGAAQAFKHKLLKELLLVHPSPIEKTLAKTILGSLLYSAALKTKNKKFDSNTQEEFTETLKVFLNRYSKDDIFLDDELKKEFRKITSFKGKSLIHFRNSILKAGSHTLV